MQNKPNMPEKYTELIGAVVLYERLTARKFRFGNRTKWVPKSLSKVIGTSLFVKHTFANEKRYEWNGTFIKGSQQTRMCAMEEMPVQEMENAAKDLQRDLNKLWKAIQDYKQVRDRQSELEETNESS